VIEQLLSRLDPDYALRLLEEMIAINSVVGGEGELATYLAGEIGALGLDCEVHEAAPGRPNVYARLQGTGPGPRLNLNGHTDTVDVCQGWETNPFTPVIRNGRIYGLGACDMKAGLACILAAFKAFVESGYPFRGELSLSAVVDEEGCSLGSRAMMDTDLSSCDAILLAEPYAGDEEMPLPLGITGKVLYDLAVQGRSAHGFRPHLGINAVEEAARIVVSLDRLPMQEHPDFGRGNTCTLRFEGGYKVYSVVVPDQCEVEINRLLVPGETAASALADMEMLLDSLELAGQVDVKLKPPRYEPFLVDRREPIVEVYHEAYQEVMGREPIYTYSAGITDANVFGEQGIPCLHLGPARGNVHQPNEYIDLEWLERLPKMYALIAARFLGS
jgi:acetylornithine deacetylase/succinyl-diaminopimelate desuccinylase family protein